jgi:DNA-binding MurR/RpiR family transcriptional regulator
MPRKPPPDYESFIAAIQSEYDDLSHTYQLIGRYLTQNPNDVAVQSIAELAAHCGTHASSLVRFAQRFGFSGFRELQAIFHKRLVTAAPGFEARVSALKSELALHDKGKGGPMGYLADLIARDIASLQDLHRRIPEAELVRAIDLMEKAESTFIIGQLRSAPIAMFLRYVLTMLKRKVVLLDANGGLATEMAKVMTPKDVLIAISFRFYAKEVVNIAESAHACGIPIIAISDSTLSPLAKTAHVLFPIPEDEYTFSRSLAAPMCLAQALMIAFAARLQAKDREKPVIPIVTLNAEAARS